MNSPWTAAIAEITSEDYIRKATTLIPPPLLDLDRMSPEEGELALLKQLSEVFIPTDQSCSIIRRLIGYMTAHMGARYSTPESFISSVYDQKPPASTAQLTVEIMGLAGVGKSEICRAISRLVRPQQHLILDGHELPIELFWTISLHNISTHSDVFAKLLSRGATQTTSLDLTTLRDSCFKEAFICGVGLLLIDEMQCFTQSDTASARTVKLLYYLYALGLPLAFISNYSLGHVLRKRPQQDQDRFLTNPIIVLPEAADSICFKLVLRAYVDAAPEVFRFDPIGDADVICRLTYGLKRKVVRLLCLAYLVARRERDGNGKVTIDHIKKAAISTTFSSHRFEVEILQKQDATGRMIRKDLWCPLNVHDTVAGQAEKEQARSDEFAAQMATAHMTNKERREEAKNGSSPTQVVPVRGKTADTMMANARAYRESRGK